VREALSRLTSEGLVVAEPQRGFRVAPISAAELRDLTGVRAHIEGLCLDRAIAVGDVGWGAQLVAAFHCLSRTPERESDDRERMSEAWSVAHAAYHKTLVSACDSPWLLRLRETLYAQSERYRRLSVSSADCARPEPRAPGHHGGCHRTRRQARQGPHDAAPRTDDPRAVDAGVAGN